MAGCDGAVTVMRDVLESNLCDTDRVEVMECNMSSLGNPLIPSNQCCLSLHVDVTTAHDWNLVFS